MSVNLSEGRWMDRAVELAAYGMNSGAGGPFGAVIVRSGKLISEGYNQVTSSLDPTAHAEVVAIRNAARRLKTFALTGCVIYSSCEPCPMCLGAVYWARLERLVFAASRDDAAEIGFDDQFLYDEVNTPRSGRTLPTHQQGRASARAVMQQWLQIEPGRRY